MLEFHNLLEPGLVVAIQPYRGESKAYRPAWCWSECDADGEMLYISSPTLMRPVVELFDEDRKREFDSHIKKMIEEGFKIEIYKKHRG